MIDSLKSHAGCHGAIANNGYGFALVRPVEPKPIAMPNAALIEGARMPNAKAVIFAFRALRKAGRAILLAHLSHLLAPTGKNFMRICLMAYIPD